MPGTLQRARRRAKISASMPYAGSALNANTAINPPTTWPAGSAGAMAELKSP